jgi:outer membrane translocation and assembly module TamA
VFAAGARLGLATGFQREVIRLDADGRPVLDAGGAPIMDLVQEVPASERFFAGGDTTVRGFALDRLGTPATLDVNGVPKGGDAVVILNGELRAPLGKNFSGVAFLDLGNVFANVRDVDLMSLRGGAGFGLRYGSPIGPIRFDIGFKLDRHRFLDGTRESPFELYIGVGQAF